MAYLLGIDEAGYGPNLGPLVVSATVWQVPDGAGHEDLYRLLNRAVAPGPCGPRDRRLAIADSKALYHAGQCLTQLERGLMAALAALNRPVARWQEVFDALAPDGPSSRRPLPWYACYDCPLPVDCQPLDASAAAQRLSRAMAGCGVRLVDLRSRVVFEDEFNALLAAAPSKGAALSQLTLELAASLIKRHAGGPVVAVCDKHGGRNFYRDLLQDAFDDAFIEIHGEGRSLSVYRFAHHTGRVEFRFQTKAESLLPVALASMASKYLRELAMRAFNHFWCLRMTGLRPTAGYPEDARRFRAEIGKLQAELGIDDGLLWRAK